MSAVGVIMFMILKTKTSLNEKDRRSRKLKRADNIVEKEFAKLLNTMGYTEVGYTQKRGYGLWYAPQDQDATPEFLGGWYT